MDDYNQFNRDYVAEIDAWRHEFGRDDVTEIDALKRH